MIDPAGELNKVLDETVAGRLLSNLGRRLYFPRGIIAQSGEAKRSAHRANATIGMAYNKGSPLILSAVAEGMPGLSPEEAVAYAPTAGFEPVREAWKGALLKKCPSLDQTRISLPAVVPGLTAGISYTADLFVGQGDRVIQSEPAWDNYALIFCQRRNAAVRGVNFFGAGPGLDLDAISQAVREEARTGQVRIILNFPNNPAGYSPSREEGLALAALLKEVAEGGADVLVICDDAYFGLFYEKETEKESLFHRMVNLHERVLAVKIDGPIKEDFVWGLRTGFITFGAKGFTQEHYQALVTKMMGAIRSSVSCANTPAQYILLKMMADPATPGEKAAFKEMMTRRYRAVKSFLASRPPHPYLRPLPFNSGYFMCFAASGLDAGDLRRDLLDRRGLGTVALGPDCLRVAFSGLDESQIEGAYETIYTTAMALGKGR